MEITAYFESPIGLLEIKGSELGVRNVNKVAFPNPQKIVAIPFRHPIGECLQQLSEYFEGNRTKFDLKLDFGDATDFYKSVWQELLKIPFGQTCAYSDIAERLKNPKAVRAVGLANRSNPIAIIVPCHRVIGKSGDLTGYFYGLDIKTQLLRHENPERFAEQTTLF
jgi:methylated-DNA-[protein]-cysteine S-methyltransferase